MGHASTAATITRDQGEIPSASVRATPALIPTSDSYMGGERIRVSPVSNRRYAPPLLLLLHLAAHAALHLLHHAHHTHARRHVVFHRCERLLRLLERFPHLRGIIRLLCLLHRGRHLVNGGCRLLTVCLTLLHHGLHG